ncbi:hypothetical protein [Flavobacterium sp.]|uniref:hypothetical protein n=1 Tax=Flavobacterium sp. TaxID=239 RepID=UPI00286CD522|nr:hypothetical protein [Flavobacterium sp.]
MITKEKFNSISKEVKKFDYNPTYQLKVTNNLCTYEIFINDLLVDDFFTTGRSAGEQNIDIPQYILKSGIQSIRIKAYPKAIRNGVLETTVDSDADLRIRIVYGEYYKQKFDDFKEVFKLKLPKVELNLPFIELEGEFKAEVPYVLDGWSKGVDLSKEDTNELEAEVIKKFIELKTTIENKDVSSFATLIYEREKEIAQAYYFDSKSSNNYNNSWQELEAEFKNSVSVELLNDYTMKYYSENKIVTLLINKGKFKNFSPLFITNIEKEKDFYEFYFYRPNPGSRLEIIR